MAIYTSAEQLIGNTPLLQLNRIKERFNLKANIYAKLEYFNLAGSIKDRVAKQMILDAEKSGLLKKDSIIIEPTSGNTGIGLASVGTAKGYKVIIVMPDTMSIERRKLIASYGAQVVLSDGKLGMKGAIEKAKEIKGECNGVILGQFDNPSNPKAHYLKTAPEIWQDLGNSIDIFVSSVGTGGTLTGNAKYLKEQKKDIKVVAVEPEKSPLLSKGVSGAHKIEGIGANFIPSILDTSLIDEIMTVSDEDAFKYGKLTGNIEGFLVGISSGAVLKCAIDLAKRPENFGKNIVVIFPDGGDRYLSTELFNF